MADGARPAGRPAARFAVLSLLGSQLDVLGEEVWLATLLALLGQLGLSESAARAQLQRMAATGWFDVDRVGRHSRYRLTERARAELRSGDRRVLEAAAPAWDGRWTIVCYELDETRRAARDRLRANLQWLGFGALQAGVWCSPHDAAEAVLAVRDRLGLGDAVQVAAGATFPAVEHGALVARCWDLEDLAARWRRLDAVRRALPRAGRGGADAFAADLTLLVGLLDVLRADPNLPAALLPAGWPGAAVRARCEAQRQRLRPAVQRHVAAVVAATEP